MFFAMAISPDHLLAGTVVASVAKECGKLEALVDLSQMTVSQMTATSTEESHQQRLHWLVEQVLNGQLQTVWPPELCAGRARRRHPASTGSSRQVRPRGLFVPP